MPTQDAVVAELGGDVVAFSDANTIWAPDALRKLVRSFADPDVGYVCGRVELERADGTNREGVYWRYELWVRESESRLAGITGGNGAIYAVRRADYTESDPRMGHDSRLPVHVAQRGRRAVYDPEALAFEKASQDSEAEFGRRVRMQAQGWLHILSGRMLRPAEPLFLAQILSHRVLRYLSGLLHLALLGSSLALAGRGGVYRTALAAQLAFLGLAAAGRLRLPLPGASIAYHYTLMTAATVGGLVRTMTAAPRPSGRRRRDPLDGAVRGEEAGEVVGAAAGQLPVGLTVVHGLAQPPLEASAGIEAALERGQRVVLPAGTAAQVEAFVPLGAGPLGRLVEDEVRGADRPAPLARGREVVVEPRLRRQAESGGDDLAVRERIGEDDLLPQRSGQRVPVGLREEVEVAGVEPPHRLLVE